jgi:hypothetical protein
MEFSHLVYAGGEHTSRKVREMQVVGAGNFANRMQHGKAPIRPT